MTGSSLAIREDQQEFNDKQIAALRQLGVKDASTGDLAVFFHQSQRTGLDPFARQIYMIGRWSREGTKQTIQTGIDGFRLVARRAADRAGESIEYEDTMWCGPDGHWVDVWLSDEPPAAARVVVLRNGRRNPATALWREYVQTNRDGSPNSMWSRMGANQLAKCAEALALRKAFPQDLSGIYTSDEMGQSTNERRTGQAVRSIGDVVAEETGELRTEAQSRKLFATAREAGLSDRDQLMPFIANVIGHDIESTKDLTRAEAGQVIDALEATPVEAEVVEPEPDGGGDPWADPTLVRQPAEDAS